MRPALRFPVTDPELDAPDGARVFVDDYQRWYERCGLVWDLVPEGDLCSST